ncbi:MAG: hypothetical protein U1F57_11770 [bacterium]
MLHEFLFHFSHPFFVSVSGLVYYLNEPMAILFILLAWVFRNREVWRDVTRGGFP